MRRLVSEVSYKYENYGRVLFIENEIVCIEQLGSHAVMAVLDEEEELQLLRHIVALVNAELEQRLTGLSNKLANAVKERDEKLKQLEGGVFDTAIEAEVDTMALMNQVNDLDNLIAEYESVIERLATFNEHLESIESQANNILKIFRDKHLWV